MSPAPRPLRSIAAATAVLVGAAGGVGGPPPPHRGGKAYDAGHGSLREAIDGANANPGADQIRFAIPGSGVHTITLLSPLPPVTDPVVIDGASQGRPTDHLIAIDGGRLSPDAVGFHLLGRGSWLHHLVMHGFGPAYPAAASAVWLDGGGMHAVTDCRLGTDAAGLVEMANRVGVYVTSPGNTIYGNLISASWESGVVVFHDDNVIDGNLLGSNRDGQAFAAPGQTNQLWGVGLYGSRNEVRRNTIGGSGGGIWLYDANDNVIVGNSIGIDGKGGRLGDIAWGIYVHGASSGNVVGGTDAGEANSLAFLGRPFPGLTAFGQAVFVAGGIDNSVRGNLMFDLSPGAMLIDLGAPGPDTNDPDDVDSGPNDLQNAPVLVDAWADPRGTGVHVDGELVTDPTHPDGYVIDLYATTAASPPGNCETRRYLGSHVIKAVAGVAKFSFVLPVTVDPGAMVSSTATQGSPWQHSPSPSPGTPAPSADTSELSACVAVR
jgi:parallel beta-helix repeat protein